MRKLFIASNNAHKIEEIDEILKMNDVHIELICPKDMEHFDEPIEDGDSFEENAYIKAKYYHDLFGFPTIATFGRVSSSSEDPFAGRYFRTSSRRSPIPVRFAAEMGYGSPIPRL